MAAGRGSEFKRLRRCGSDFKPLRKCVESRNWSELPIGLLLEILDRLILIDDYLIFGTVCASWRFALAEDKKRSYSKSSPLPLLLIPPDDYEQDFNLDGKTNRKRKREIRSLYSVSNKNICNFKVNLPHNKYCRGSSFGWLVTMQRRHDRGDENYKLYIQLYNPFISDRRNTLNLPRLDNIVQNDGDIQQRPFLYIRKAALSSDPLLFVQPKRNDFVVMAIVSKFCKLVFFKSGNKAWIPLEWDRKDWIPPELDRNEWGFFEDVIYSNKTQQFYALLDTGVVIAIDFNNNERGRVTTPNLKQITPPPPTQPGLGWYKKYLVETSTGELWQVLKEFFYTNGDSTMFQVFKFDHIGVNWIRMHNIGDNIFFLGENASTYHSASDFPECKPNCIYYTQDLCLDQRSAYRYGLHETGIFNLEDETIQPHYDTTSRSIFPNPIWIEPTLQRFR
ncbi:hypothetical protein AQUCO_06600039v1 [Aquilegia coerulea]|uniref:Uncharacterized protein n=1 Tax=Aquilegia coerulea TaxID=218851 RepID=A0A2G5CC57_AQUCA|nr:hypothetical protein AQUCO_06600039v1 [Aquilegia coerulea]